jgi:hypothetical protein
LRAELLMAKGQYSYGFPAGVSYEQVREVSTAQRTSASWIPVLYGIDDTMIKFGDVNSESGDPPQFWRVSGGSAFRIWPTPVTSNWVLAGITGRFGTALTPPAWFIITGIPAASTARAARAFVRRGFRRRSENNARA